MGLFKQSLLAMGAVFALSGPAAATPVTWQLQNAVFAGGRTATGSFVFDADTNVYSNINVDTGPAFAFHYGVPNPFFPVDSTLAIWVTAVLPDYSGTPALVIPWSTPLTNAGGVVPFGFPAFEGGCNADCTFIVAVGDFIFVSGEAVSVAVAEPASLTLLAVGLLGMTLGWRRSRRSVVTR
jgi:hypothetical protein